MGHSNDHENLSGGDSDRISRRFLFRRVAPAAGLALVAGDASGTPPPARVERRMANVADFGAKGDGITDDAPAFRAALAAAAVVEVPAGSFRIGATLRLRDGQVIRGAGRSGWEPYSGEGEPQSAVHTEIVVDGRLALDARNTNNVAIAGLAIRALGGRQSGWGASPGHQGGAAGIDITGAYQFYANDVSFHGLEVGVSSIADNGRPTQMPHIGNWVAHDCDTVFRFLSSRDDFQVVRDARIEGCVAAIHCGNIVVARNCDGLRIENVRFFQCAKSSILIEKTPFVSIIGATLFETTFENVILRDCAHATISGAQFVRAGYFRKGKLLQQSSVVLDRCSDLSFSGLIEQPIGRAFTISNCTNLSIHGAIGMPYWTTGNLANHDGAVRIEKSRAISISLSFSGLGYWIAVWSDAFSADSISGNISTEGAAGVVRCIALQPHPLGQRVRVREEQRVSARTSTVLDVQRVLVPAGKSLVTRSAEITTPHFLFDVAGQHLRIDENEPGGGSLSFERKVLARNNSPEARYFPVEISVYNPTAAPLTLPAGCELRLSLALE